MISNPLKKIMNAIKEAKEGNLSAVIIDDNNNEFGIVSRNFNKMMKTLKYLVINIKNEADKVSSRTTRIE